MVDYTIFEKLSIISKIIINEPIFLIILLGIGLMFVDLFFISKRDSKTKHLYIFISIFLISLLIYSYFSSFIEVIDSINKGIVTFIYFPNVLQYMIVILIMLIAMVLSLFSNKNSLKIKVINTFVASINLLLFFIILDQISKFDVDLTNKLTIYSNTNLMILFQISIIIFVVWITSLVIYKIIKKLINKKEELPVLENFYEEPILPKTIEEVRKEKQPFINDQIKVDQIFTLDEYYKIKELLLLLKNSQNKSS